MLVLTILFSFRLSEQSEHTEKSLYKKLSPFIKGSCSNVEGFIYNLSFRLSERSERTEKSLYKNCLPFSKGAVLPVVLRGRGIYLHLPILYRRDPVGLRGRAYNLWVINQVKLRSLLLQTRPTQSCKSHTV